MPDSKGRETIWEALERKLVRVPTNAEASVECRRIITEAYEDRARDRINENTNASSLLPSFAYCP